MAVAGKYHTISVGDRLQGRNVDNPVPITKYSGNGLTFKARFVGSEPVMDNKGDKIAQATIARIRAACREAGGNKPKVLINLSLNGIKVADLKTKIWSLNVPIPQLTYVCRDANDAAVFCIIVARKKGGFKLLVYKSDPTTSTSVVQSVKELFKVVYHIVQQKKQKAAAEKSKSSTDVAKKSPTSEIVRATSDSRLLDPPPDYTTAKMEYHAKTLPPPTADNTDFTTKKTPRPDSGIYAMPFANTLPSTLPENHYQVPSNKPAPVLNEYQVPTNRPAYPAQKRESSASLEWQDLNTQLLNIAMELNAYAGNDSSTPERAQTSGNSTRPSQQDPFGDDFFAQPFNADDNLFMEFNSMSPGSTGATERMASLSPKANPFTDDDDPFSFFETDGGVTTSPSPSKPPTSSAGEGQKSTDDVPVQPAAAVVKTTSSLVTLPSPPKATIASSKIQAAPTSTAPTASRTSTTLPVDAKRLSQNWTTFDEKTAGEPLYAVADQRLRIEASPSPTSDVFEDSFTNLQPQEESTAAIQPPPRTKRASRRSSGSRPLTVYGNAKTTTATPSASDSTSAKTLTKFDLASIKPKTSSAPSDEDQIDPFMEFATQRFKKQSTTSEEECTYF